MQQIRTIKLKNLFVRLTDDEHLAFYQWEIVDALEILFTNIPDMITAYEAFKVRLDKEELIGKWNKKMLSAIGKKQGKLSLKGVRLDVDKAFEALLQEVNAAGILGEAVESDPAVQAGIHEIADAVNSSLKQLEQVVARKRSKAIDKSKPAQLHILNPTMPKLSIES